MEELTPRRKRILSILVREYIATAVPVGSSTIARMYQGKVSSATVRSDLVYLDEHEYLIQPHTSAGRIPSDKGYRYFVEQLMEENALTAQEQRMIRHQFHQVQLRQEQWIKLAAAVLARMSQSVSLVTEPRARLTQFRHAELISISETKCLLVLVLQDGTIRQEIMALSQPAPQDELSRVANHLNEMLHNFSLRQMLPDVLAKHKPVPLSQLERNVLDRIFAIMKDMEKKRSSEIYQDGLVNVLSQPEFAQSDQICRIVETLQRRSLFESIVEEILCASGVQVIIGGEGRWGEMEDLSLVLSRYGINDEASGVLGVLGPTRMRYGRSISAVRYVAQLLTGLVEELYGS